MTGMEEPLARGPRGAGGRRRPRGAAARDGPSLVNGVVPAFTRFYLARQPSLREAVVQQLIETIVGGALAIGAMLPIESELMQQFGVSRTVVREAIKVLEEKGLVRARQGSGTTVLPRECWDMLDPDILATELDGPGAERLLEELTRIRIALECELAEEAASRISDAQLAEMAALLGRMRGLVDRPDEYLDADVAFHDLILATAENRIGQAIMRAMHEPLRRSRRITNRIPGGVQRAQEFHEGIFEQVRRRDTVGARASMREHLAWAWEAYCVMQAHGPDAAATALGTRAPA